MTTRASPWRMRRHSSYFSPWDRAECSTAATSPKRARNQETIWHEQDRALAAQQRLAHGADVDLRLAAAGHPVQEEGLRLAVERGADAARGVLLAGAQAHLRALVRQVLVGPAPHALGEDLRKALLLQGAGRGGAGRRKVRKAHALRAFRKARDQLPLPLGALAAGECVLLRRGQAHGQARQGLEVRAHLRGQDAAQRGGHGAAVFHGQPARKVHQLRQDHGLVVHARKDGAQLFRGDVRLLRQLHDDPGQAARAEGQRHALADRKVHARRHRVGEAAVHLLAVDVHDDKGVRAHSPPRLRAFQVSCFSRRSRATRSRMRSATSVFCRRGKAVSPCRS